MAEKLADLLRRLRLETLVRQAEIVRDYPAGDERTREAQRLILFVMYEHAVGRLTNAERRLILGIVDFARDWHEPPEGLSASDLDALD